VKFFGSWRCKTFRKDDIFLFLHLGCNLLRNLMNVDLIFYSPRQSGKISDLPQYLLFEYFLVLL